MMYRYGDGDIAWMTVMMPLTWLLLVGFAVWLGVRWAQGSSKHVTSPAATPTTRETPEEILDRRFASGEIDAETHMASRRQLKELPR